MGKRGRTTQDSDEETLKKKRIPAKGEINDDQEVAYFEKKVRGEREWLEAARRATSLPVKFVTDDNRVVLANKADVDHEKEELAKKAAWEAKERREKKKQEKREAKKRASSASEKAALHVFKSRFLNAQERMDLRKAYPTYVASTEAMKLIITDIGEKLMANPETNLYWMELILHAMGTLQAQWEQETDLDERKATGKLLLVNIISAGKMLEQLLPAYVMADRNKEDEDDGEGDKKHGAQESLSKATRALRKHEDHLLDVYRRFLFRHFFELLKSNEYKRLLIPFLCHFSSTAIHTNFQTEYVHKLVDVLFSMTNADIKEIDMIVESIRAIFAQDLTLVLSCDLTKEAMKQLTNAYKPQNKKGNRRRGRRVIACEAAVSRLLKSFKSLDISKKERNAALELQRSGLHEGLDLSKSRDITEIKLDRKMMRSVTAGLVHGDWRRFRQFKATILTELLTFFSRVLRNPSGYPLGVVYETLWTLAEYATEVNVELMVEFLEELKKLCEYYRHNAKLGGVLLLACVFAAVKILELSPVSGEVQSDGSWIAEVLITALQNIYIDIKDPIAETEEEEQEHMPVSENPLGRARMNMEELLSSLEGLIGNKNLFGASLTGMCPEAIELFLSLITAGSMSQGWNLETLGAFGTKMLRRYPTIRDTMDDEGIIVSSLVPPYTIAWVSHLMSSQSVDLEMRALSATLKQHCNQN
eukprot:Blabericola_migrator_1__3427@NODE_2008_length_3429_cov_45_632064_g1274_i0_p1_GENE_NODE_2008_length_3429_cov_45_632064_g1274_i0NODE_2008_length_3429_cov_45_632064_g1274_i0_p1_ORF_typecomplete_len702_score155_26NOC3p/PF07540_11/1_1e04NOC3p/PF07540_11/4_9e07NOC3p/PF07540_11/4_9e03NOC3p/PF07540_11/8_8e03NOC3p/PF07540_11/1_3e04DUF3408/PF11888_8/0_088DUF3391/PF11871_8/0_89DUF3391/PF11871_8/2_2e03DUF3391/PF11871_8/5_6e03_NODE_2008_length_3429_cov_45_632064_g1274_i011653270